LTKSISNNTPVERVPLPPMPKAVSTLCVFFDFVVVVVVIVVVGIVYFGTVS
jgi:hypothetical protein